MDDSVDLILKNGIIITADNDNTIFYNADIAVKNGKIFDTGKKLSYKSLKTQDLEGALVIPGLINTHAHAAMTLFRGLADDLPLMEWLNNHIFPAESLLKAEYVYQGTLLACLEMIKSGITCFCDMYFFEDEAAMAAQKAGIKMFAGEGIINFPTPSCESPEQALETTKFLYEKYKDDPLVSVCAAPHSVYLTDEKYLKAAGKLSLEYNIPFIIHLSETASEVENIKEQTGLSPVKYLESLGLLNSNVLAVHCVVLDEEDINILKKYNVKVSHNPESNLKLASGIAPVPELLDAGIPVSLGTDGAASNNDLCILSEMDTAAKLHKVNKLDPTVVSAREVIRMATIEGAKALGIDGVTGSIENGKDADLVVLNPDLPGLTPMYNPESHIVYAASRREVKDVYIRGRQVLGNGKILTADTKAVIQAVSSIAQKIYYSDIERG